MGLTYVKNREGIDTTRRRAEMHVPRMSEETGLGYYDGDIDSPTSCGG